MVSELEPLLVEQDGSQADAQELNLSLRVSHSLLKKLKQVALAEGVETEYLALELLAEGLVLRAWESAERKAIQRKPQQSSPRQSKNSSSKGGKRRGHNSSNRRDWNGPGSYNAIMDDSATFLEYVRSQEKKGT